MKDAQHSTPQHSCRKTSIHQRPLVCIVVGIGCWAPEELDPARPWRAASDAFACVAAANLAGARSFHVVSCYCSKRRHQKTLSRCTLSARTILGADMHKPSLCACVLALLFSGALQGMTMPHVSCKPDALRDPLSPLACLQLLAPRVAAATPSQKPSRTSAKQ